MGLKWAAVSAAALMLAAGSASAATYTFDGTFADSNGVVADQDFTWTVDFGDPYRMWQQQDVTMDLPGVGTFDGAVHTSLTVFGPVRFTVGADANGPPTILGALGFEFSRGLFAGHLPVDFTADLALASVRSFTNFRIGVDQFNTVHLSSVEIDGSPIALSVP